MNNAPVVLGAGDVRNDLQWRWTREGSGGEFLADHLLCFLILSTTRRLERG